MQNKYSYESVLVCSLNFGDLIYYNGIIYEFFQKISPIHTVSMVNSYLYPEVEHIFRPICTASGDSISSEKSEDLHVVDYAMGGIKVNRAMYIEDDNSASCKLMPASVAKDITKSSQPALDIIIADLNEGINNQAKLGCNSLAIGPKYYNKNKMWNVVNMHIDEFIELVTKLGYKHQHVFDSFITIYW